MNSGQLLCNEPLSRHTSWRVGGCADRYYQPTDIGDLANYLRSLPAEEPVFWLGLGSNLLVRDKGIRGTVIAPLGGLRAIQVVGDREIRAEVGATCARIARFGAANGLLGAEFLAGIPGTLGGALAMNAGCYGGTTWSLVQEVETLDRQGVRRTRTPQEYQIGYRQVLGPLRDEWFIAARLQLTAGATEEGQAKIRTLLAERGQSQPTDKPTCGSVFKNPAAGGHAAELIEQAGLKGFRVGNASVSEKHANFIINEGNATARDIEQLIEQIADQVEQTHGVRLLPEVRMIGEKE